MRVEVALPDVPSAEPTPLDVPADVPGLPDGPQGQAIAVIALKGGVGRSTIAANLAVALARWHGKRIILVDADLWRGDVGVLLNLPFGRGMADLVPPPDEVLDLEKVQGALRAHPWVCGCCRPPPIRPSSKGSRRCCRRGSSTSARGWPTT